MAIVHTLTDKAALNKISAAKDTQTGVQGVQANSALSHTTEPRLEPIYETLQLVMGEIERDSLSPPPVKSSRSPRRVRLQQKLWRSFVFKVNPLSKKNVPPELPSRHESKRREAKINSKIKDHLASSPIAPPPLPEPLVPPPPPSRAPSIASIQPLPLPQHAPMLPGGARVVSETDQRQSSVTVTAQSPLLDGKAVVAEEEANLSFKRGLKSFMGRLSPRRARRSGADTTASAAIDKQGSCNSGVANVTSIVAGPKLAFSPPRSACLEPHGGGCLAAHIVVGQKRRLAPRLARVIKANLSTEDGHLGLTVGSMVQVTAQPLDGMWTGRIGKGIALFEGCFPPECVELIRPTIKDKGSV